MDAAKLVEEWTSEHSRWPELLRVVEAEHRTAWFTSQMKRHLKLSMGFAVHPVRHGDDTGGVHFVLPLRGSDS